jgi:hypothetical protein
MFVGKAGWQGSGVLRCVSLPNPAGGEPCGTWPRRRVAGGVVQILERTYEGANQERGLGEG